MSERWTKEDEERFVRELSKEFHNHTPRKAEQSNWKKLINRFLGKLLVIILTLVVVAVFILLSWCAFSLLEIILRL